MLGKRNVFPMILHMATKAKLTTATIIDTMEDNRTDSSLMEGDLAEIIPETENIHKINQETGDLWEILQGIENLLEITPGTTIQEMS